MQQPTPPPLRPGRRLRRTALGLVATVVVASGVVAGGQAAFASTDSTFAALSSDFSNGVDDIYLGANITKTDGTLTLGPATGTSGHTMLHLTNGTTLTVQAIELTSNQAGTMTPSTLVITGSGSLVVAQTDPSLPAIEVSAGSALTISSGTVTASVPSASTAAAIGGGTSMGPGPENAGSLTFNGNAHVSAVGGDQGAAIGGGYGGSATIAIDDSATVSASVTGRAAAIGAGAGSGSFSISAQHSAAIVANQYGTNITGAAIGGGASPAGQIAGSVTAGDEASLTATSLGRGAAIGGGYHGDGGSVTATGYAHITATGAQSAIGDGEFATGSGSTMSFSGQGVQVTASGGTGSSGGAGIGGSLNAYGNDTLTADGGATVTASSQNGPGIGGLGNTQGMSVTIGNAVVTATGGSGGAAVGAGNAASLGTTLSIGSGGSLTVSGGTTAIGGSTGRFGSLSNSGSLTVAGGSTVTIPSGATASTSGTYTNLGTTTVNGELDNSGIVSNTGAINGSGTLGNTGSVLQNGTLSTASVTGNAFNVVYDGQGGTKSASSQLVYADSIAAAGQSIATSTPPSTGTFTGWNTLADGTGSAVTATSSLSAVGGGSATGVPFRITAYALYQIAPVLPTSTTLPQAVVGTAYSATVGATAGTAPIAYQRSSGDLPAGLSLNGSTGAITGTPTTAGTFTMTVQAQNSFTATHQYTIQVVPAPITVAVPTTAKGSTWYLAGGVASLRIGGLQANETYTVKIGGKTAATGKAASNAAFTKKVTIPKSIGDGSQTVSVSGGEHASAATAKILTASVSKSLGLKLSAKTVKHGKKITVTVSKLYAGESVRVVISGKHGKTAVGKATSKGGYVLTLKSGLAKGKYTVTVTGAGTSRKASAKLTVS